MFSNGTLDLFCIFIANLIPRGAQAFWKLCEGLNFNRVLMFGVRGKDIYQQVAPGMGEGNLGPGLQRGNSIKMGFNATRI